MVRRLNKKGETPGCRSEFGAANKSDGSCVGPSLQRQPAPRTLSPQRNGSGDRSLLRGARLLSERAADFLRRRRRTLGVARLGLLLAARAAARLVRGLLVALDSGGFLGRRRVC